MKNELKDRLFKVLFHGTLYDRALDIQMNGIDFSKLNNRADFGKGFYLTDSYALAETTAKTRYYQEILKTGDSTVPVVLKVKIYCKDFSNYKIKEFYGESNEWKRFVCTNRWAEPILSVHPEYDNNIDLKYDIVVGLTADGKIRSFNSLLAKDKYELSDNFIKEVKPFVISYCKDNRKENETKTRAYQISLHNEQFINSCVKYKDCVIIELEKEDGDYE